jgi:hypothetical protein
MNDKARVNVIIFPACLKRKTGRIWYGGREFDTEDEVIDSMSDKDRRWADRWISRNAAYLERRKKRQA